MKTIACTLGAWLCLAVSSHAGLIYADGKDFVFRINIIKGASDPTDHWIGFVWEYTETVSEWEVLPSLSAARPELASWTFHEEENVSVRNRVIHWDAATPPFTITWIDPDPTDDDDGIWAGSLGAVVSVTATVIDDNRNGYLDLYYSRPGIANRSSFAVSDPAPSLPLAALSILGLTALRSRFRR